MVNECVYRILLSYFTACVSLCIPCSLVCSPLVYSALVHSGSYFLCFSVPTAKRITFLPHLFQSLFLPFSHSNTQNTQRHTHTRAHTYTRAHTHTDLFFLSQPLVVRSMPPPGRLSLSYSAAPCGRVKRQTSSILSQILCASQ